MSNNGLGRGLGSLIPDKKNQSNNNPTNTVPDNSSDDQVMQVEIGKIKVNPMQPRKSFTDSQLKELAGSIKEYGVIQPLIVSRQGTDFELIAGERRLRAAKIAGLDKVPVILRKVDDREKLEVALIENIQRENLNPIDLAAAYHKLIDQFDLTQKELADRLGKSRSGVANTLRLLNLPDEIQVALVKGKISEGHAKYLIGLDTEVKQMSLFRKIIHNNLSVGETDKHAKIMGGTKMARVKINYADKDKEFAFREFFGAKVEIKRKGRGGQVIINFFSNGELDEIVDKIKK